MHRYVLQVTDDKIMMEVLDSERSDECIDFTMFCVFNFFVSVYTRTCQNNASFSNYGSGKMNLVGALGSVDKKILDEIFIKNTTLIILIFKYCQKFVKIILNNPASPVYIIKYGLTESIKSHIIKSKP
ncbi:Uncharacterized protein FWK35_00021206 [Aphis craccivora]|uniref:Uncharacterized protein n=1 Tax=Aphis craccivora TaxID=307492 RepID=A0A6G0ZGC6_APHCR|nr:Uncharacterized protein FWK35_00021206 [Aphis craccivora]